MRENILALRYASRRLFREGILTRHRASVLLKNEYLPLNAIWIENALRNTLRVANMRLPAYRRRCPPYHQIVEFFGEYIPIITKEYLISGRSDYYPNSGERRWFWPSGKTSGTSGTPLEVFRSLDSILWEQAHLLQHWQWAGHGPGSKQVVLRGDMVVPVNRVEPPFWITDSVGRTLYISSRHLNEKTIKCIHAAIEKFGARFLRSYPSTAYELARLVSEHNLTLKFDSIQTSSELLHDTHRHFIESIFDASIFDFYGMAERVALAMECEHGNLHVNPYYSYVEIVDANGSPTQDIGQLVGTTFHNSVMPLLRYRLNDEAQWIPGTCRCGRTYPMIRLRGGKMEDRIFDLDGRPISPSVITFAFKGILGIARSQVAQVAEDKWEIRIVPTLGFSEDMAVKLLGNIRSLVSERLTVSLHIATNLSSTTAGKFKWVTQEWRSASRQGAVV